MKKITLAFLGTAFVAASAWAGTEVTTTGKETKDYKTPEPAAPCFRDQELQLDLFGSYMNLPHSDDQTEHHHRAGHDGGGGGVGINYFFLRYMGIGADGDVDTNRDGVTDYMGKLLFRFPIETHGLCLAPYLFGGAGGETFFHDDWNYDHRRDHRTQGAYMTGAGIEYRVTQHIGVFTEGRYTWTMGRNNDGDNAQARLGVRFAF